MKLGYSLITKVAHAGIPLLRCGDEPGALMPQGR